jgi:isopenicillin-N N-acyltransferase-like protein
MNHTTENAAARPSGFINKNDEFPLFDVAGTAADIGFGYGRQAADYVHRSVAIYQSAFARKGVPWDRALGLAKEFAPRIEKYHPAMLEEIRGIAEGAGLPLEVVVAINARTELLYGRRPAARNSADSDGDGCTGAIAMPEATANQHTLHGQNWDWRDECADSSVVLRVRPATGPAMLIFVEAGLLARCGFNSAGVAISGNFLQSDQDYGRDGIPIPFIRRRVLMSESIGEAVRAVMSAPRAFSNNLMISQSEGEGINLETTPGEVFWIQPDEGLLVHANHFISSAARAKVRDVGLETNADSLYRDRRVRSHLTKRLGQLRVEDFQAAFADRYGAPRAVCRSPITGPGGKTSSTVASIVMDTTEKKMWIARRPYEAHRYVEYSLG